MLSLKELLQLLLFLLELLLENDKSLRSFGSLDRLRQLRFHGAGKHSVKRIVIARRDRIELVIVAAGASNRQTHQTAGRHVNAVVDDVVDVVHEAAAQGEKTHGR